MLIYIYVYKKWLNRKDSERERKKGKLNVRENKRNNTFNSIARKRNGNYNGKESFYY